MRSPWIHTFAACLLSMSVGACASDTDDAIVADTQNLEGEFTDLSKAEIVFPQDPSGPLTMDDITVVKGFDGKPPEEVAAIVRANIEGTVHRSKEAFLRERTIEVHKSWTLVIANAFAKDFPAAKFVQTVASEDTEVLIVGTPRGDIFLVTSNPDDGEQWYLAKGNSFEPMAVASGYKPFTPPIMRAELRVHPPGVRIEYPKWKWAPLAGETTITVEWPDGTPP